MTRYPMVRNGNPCFGRIENLYHDNAFHFIGDNIAEAARALGMNLVRLQPREPWLKGALEKLFKDANVGLVHHLPGTTLGNVVTRRDHEHLGKATMIYEQFDQLLNFWICDIYNAGHRRALGHIRGFGGQSPLQAWNAKVRDYETDALPKPEVFIALSTDLQSAEADFRSAKAEAQWVKVDWLPRASAGKPQPAGFWYRRPFAVTLPSEQGRRLKAVHGLRPKDYLETGKPRRLRAVIAGRRVLVCLAIPGRITDISGDDPIMRVGRVDFGGVVKEINLAYVPEARVGDYVLVHVGFALTVIDEVEADRVFEQLSDIAEIEAAQKETAL